MTTYHPNGGVDAAETGHSQTGLADQVRDTVAEQTDALRQRGAELRDQVAESARQTRDQVADTTRTASAEGARFVRENPGLALAGALGLGLLIGLSVRTSRY